MNLTFDELYKEYEKYVRAAVARHVRSADVDDVAQNVFMNVHQRLDTPVENWKTCIDTIIRNECGKHRRHKDDAVSLDTPIGDESDGLTLGDTLGQRDDPNLDQIPADELHAAVEKLSPLLRHVVEMHYYGGQSLEDISFILSTKLGTIKKRLHDARVLLRHILLSEDEQNKVA